MKAYPYLLLSIAWLAMSFAIYNVYAEDEVDIREPLIHVIMSEEIRDIMLQLNQLHEARDLTPLQTLERRVKYLNDIAETTRQLTTAAEQLTEAIPGISMTPENRQIFEALARQLSNEATELRELAIQTNYTGMEPAYQRMSTTCEACHRLFRF